MFEIVHDPPTLGTTLPDCTCERRAVVPRCQGEEVLDSRIARCWCWSGDREAASWDSGRATVLITSATASQTVEEMFIDSTRLHRTLLDAIPNVARQEEKKALARTLPK